MLERKKYASPFLVIKDIEKTDVVTASVGTRWKTSWGESWDDWNIGEEL